MDVNEMLAAQRGGENSIPGRAFEAFGLAARRSQLWVCKFALVEDVDIVEP
jgi:hypothetical protein